MHKWKIVTPALIALLAVVTYLGAAFVAHDQSDRLADTGARIVKRGCDQTNTVASVTRLALLQQKNLSQQKYERGATTRPEWLVQQAALNKAIRGLAPRDCATEALALRRSV